jgi:hypothetical protein
MDVPTGFTSLIGPFARLLSTAAFVRFTVVLAVVVFAEPNAFGELPNDDGGQAVARSKATDPATTATLFHP